MEINNSFKKSDSSIKPSSNSKKKTTYYTLDLFINEPYNVRVIYSEKDNKK